MNEPINKEANKIFIDLYIALHLLGKHTLETRLDFHAYIQSIQSPPPKTSHFNQKVTQNRVTHTHTHHNLPPQTSIDFWLSNTVSAQMDSVM